MTFTYPNDYTKENARSSNPEVLAWILERNNDDIITLIVAENPTTPSSALEKYFIKQQHDTQVVRAIASNPNTPLDTLTWMVEHGKSTWYAIRACNNPSTPVEVLDDTLLHGRMTLKWEIAKNPRISSHVLAEILEKGEKDLVSCHVANNPSTPSDAVAKWREKTGIPPYPK